MIALSSRDALFSAMRSARRIDVGAYMLGSGDVLDAIEGALERGARVTVRIEGTPFGNAGGVGRA
ncbi:MAG: hypothetical protein M3R35_01880, partial [Candidatus Eremiobacteraeota bacterium]|nr:hypothetical protein [Candidatus Eremiobacteraeota bacterium]